MFDEEARINQYHNGIPHININSSIMYHNDPNQQLIDRTRASLSINQRKYNIVGLESEVLTN